MPWPIRPHGDLLDKTCPLACGAKEISTRIILKEKSIILTWSDEAGWVFATEMCWKFVDDDFFVHLKWSSRDETPIFDVRTNVHHSLSDAGSASALTLNWTEPLPQYEIFCQFRILMSQFRSSVGRSGRESKIHLRNNSLKWWGWEWFPPEMWAVYLDANFFPFPTFVIVLKWLTFAGDL